MARGSIKRIQKMEESLNQCAKMTEELTSALSRLKGIQIQTQGLFDYYGSEAWYADRDMKLTADISAGVLSEDLIYDEITELRDLAIEMLEIGTEILRDWI